VFPTYESLVGSDRPKLLRQLGWCIIFMVASCWLFIGIASADRTEAWRTEFFSHAGSGLWAFSVSAIWIVTGLLLVMRLPWAWWLACVVLSGFLAYACFGFYPFITSMVFFLLWIFITFFFASAPANTFVPETMQQDLDEMAQSLGLRWEDQPLWQLVEQAKKGPLDDVVMIYRDRHHVTWDEAFRAIEPWRQNTLGLKVYLLKEHLTKGKS
jgi:hypothetical protein